MRTEDSHNQRALRFMVFLSLTVPLIGYCGDEGESPTEPVDVPADGCGMGSVGMELVNEDDQRVQFVVGGYSVYLEANSTEHYLIYEEQLVTITGDTPVIVQLNPNERINGDEVFLAQTTCTKPANPVGGRIVWDGITLTCAFWA